MAEPVLIQPAPLPPPDEIRRNAVEILRNPDYVLDNKQMENGWYDALIGFFERLLRPVTEAFDSLFAFSPLLYYLMIVGMVAAMIGMAAHIWISLQRAIRAKRGGGAFAPSDFERPLTAEDWERRAGEARERGDFIGAVRFLFQASLFLLWQARKERPPRGTTNRELLQRYRDTPVLPALQAFVQVIDWKWYSDQPCTPEDYESCALAHRHIRRLVGETPHA